jgi:hypothetical protein
MAVEADICDPVFELYFLFFAKMLKNSSNLVLLESAG